MRDNLSSRDRHVQRSHSWLWYGILLLFVLLAVSACGPERRKSKNNEPESQTVSIAESFMQDGNLDAARSQLDELDVANSMQWLVMQAEGAIDTEPDSEQTRALAQLALELGTQSPAIVAYAAQVGLLPSAAISEAVASENTNTTGANAVAAAVEPVQDAIDTPAPAPTVEVILMEPTALDLPTATAQTLDMPTATAIPIPRIVASISMNVRGGPGTNYPIVQAMESGQEADIIGKNDSADWWQVQLPGNQLGWVYGQLVSANGNLDSVALTANIPEPPPTSTPAPVIEQPADAPEPEAPEAEAPETEAAPAPSGPVYKVVERRLWNVYENGGTLNGPSVTCGEKRQLVVNVIDANGQRLNGVAVQAEFGAKEIFVTGSQGKGDGVVEFILGEGQDVRVIRDVDGSDVSSEVARGMVTKPAGISYEDLIGGQFCTNDADCKTFVDAPGCYGHYSWTVTFQRNY